MHSSPFPLEHLCTAVGMLGGCLTQAARASEISAVQLAAASIRAALLPSVTTDGAMAGRMRDLFSTRRLPLEFLAHGVDAEELRGEFEDGLEYSRSADGRRLVEEKRILLLGTRSASALSPLPPAYTQRLAPPGGLLLSGRRHGPLRPQGLPCLHPTALR